MDFDLGHESVLVKWEREAIVIDVCARDMLC